LESEISEELKEVYDLYKYEYAHRQRLYEKKMEVWQKRHEEFELLREQRKKEFQEKLNTGLHKFVGKAKELSIDDTLQIEENTPKDNEDIESLQKKKPKKIKVQAIQWLDDVYEDPMPVEPKEKIYKEEQLRKEISKVHSIFSRKFYSFLIHLLENQWCSSTCWCSHHNFCGDK
jgi:hypothetical protein